LNWISSLRLEYVIMIAAIRANPIILRLVIGVEVAMIVCFIILGFLVGWKHFGLAIPVFGGVVIAITCLWFYWIESRDDDEYRLARCRDIRNSSNLK
jgi:drug/metabolite transporter superfamily protein YnfA